jgi:ribonuclease G
MSKELVISTAPHETRVAILEEGQLCEIYIEREKEFALVGSIYKGRVTRVLPGMQSAFVDIGLDGDAFLYVSDVFENLEEYDHEPRPERAEEQGAGTAAPPAPLGEGEAVLEGAAAPSAAESQEPQPIAGETLPGEVFAGEQAETAEPLPRTPQGGMAPPRYERGERQGQGFRGDLPADRHGRGGHRGRDRWGRGGRRGRGGRLGRGRELPPSKYAPPQAGEPRGHRGESFERPPADRRGAPPLEEEPILLPGESLAKYKDRAPSAPAASGVESPVQEREPELQTEQQPSPGEELARRPEHRFGLPAERHGPSALPGPARPVGARPAGGRLGRLPSWVLADSSRGETEPTAEVEASEAESTGQAAAQQSEASAAQELPVSETQAAFEAPPVAPPLEEELASHPEPELSEEEVNSLAEQLAQAKHEETHEEADADAFSGGADLEEQEAPESEDEGEEGEEEAGHVEMAETPEELEEAEAAQVEAEAETEPQPEMIEAAAGQAPASVTEPEHDLLPGETRAPRDRAEYEPRAARIEERPQARFQSRPAGRRGPGPGRGGRPGYRDHGGRRYRGPRPGGHERRSYGPPRRPQLISEMLKPGQEVIVQIAKEPLGKKGARITSHVALPGRYLVYMPTIDHIGVSRKIAAVENRARLRRLVGEARGSYPGGFIVRTAAGSASDDDIRADIEFLGRTWNQIKAQSEQRKAPSLLHRDLNLVERILRDYVNEEYSAIWIDNEEEYGKVLEFVGRFQPKLVNRVKLFTKDTPIFEEFGIQHELDKALRPKVWLKSGGYIVINHTEALVAIDVNTGKFVGKGSVRLEDTIVKTNIEAVKEIVRQIRLRDLGGIIVVDFIDMEERRNREKVMQALQQALETDKAPSKVLSFNEFGLVAITRKRTKQALERVLCQPCPYCSGSGMVKSIPTICYEIQNEARKMAVDHDAPNLTLRVHPEIAKALKTRESMLIDELEQTTHKHVIIQSDATLHWEQYDIY